MAWLACVLSNVVLASLVGVAAWFVQRRMDSPSVARVLWLLVLVKLITPPWWIVPLGATDGSLACAMGTCGCEHHVVVGAESAMVRFAPPVFLGVWGAGTLVAGAITIRRWRRFHALLRHSHTAPRAWCAIVDRIGRQLALRRIPEVVIVPGRLPPFVLAGWPRPRLVLPAELVGSLSGARRTALVVHELSHVRHGDHLVRVLEAVVGVIYWWLPLGRTVGHGLRDCEEARCDAAVVARLPDARREYAGLLLDVIDFSEPGLSVPATAMSAANQLETRIRTILRPRASSPRNRFVALAIMGLALATLPCQVWHPVLGWSVANAADQRDRSAKVGISGVQPEGPSVSAFCCPSS